MSTDIHPDERVKFNQLAAEWWDNEGPMKALHAINPLRMKFIQQHVTLSNLHVLDVGCGGGILCESLAKAGAHVTGLDMAEDVLQTARLHLLESKLNVQYVCQSIETFSQTHAQQFDVICCMEMLEHTDDPNSIMQAISTLIKPGGHLFLSTINRSPMSYLCAIIGAEYILNLLPKHTHNYSQFITPSELENYCEHNGFSVQDIQGIHYSVLTKQFSLQQKPSVNYLMHARKSLADFL